MYLHLVSVSSKLILIVDIYMVACYVGQPCSSCVGRCYGKTFMYEYVQVSG